MAFPETSILDDFNRGNTGPPLGGNWTEIARGDGGFEIISNEAYPEGTSELDTEYWNVEDFGPDCECYLTFTDVMTYGSVQARIQDEDSATDFDGYVVQWRQPDSQVRIYRIDDNSDTQLGDSISQVISSGDKIGISVVGANPGTITAYYNDGGAGWGSLGSEEDSTYDDAGKIGIDSWNSGDNTAIDDFGGGTIVSGDLTISESDGLTIGETTSPSMSDMAIDVAQDEPAYQGTGVRVLG